MGILVLVVMLIRPAEVVAQDTHFGISPSARTQRALGDPPTRSSREQRGVLAALGIAYTHHTNVRRQTVSGSEEEGDSAVVITPQAAYKRFIGRHSAEIGASSEFTRFEDLTEENTETYELDGLVNLDITRKLDLDLFASYVDTAEPRGGSGTRLGQDLVPDKVEIRSYGGAFTVGRRDSRIQLELGADRSQWRYRNNQQGFRDRDDDGVQGRIYYNISPRTSVFTGARITDVNFIQPGTGTDNEELAYEVGGRWDVGAKTTGHISLGRAEKDFDNPSLEDVDATVLAGRLGWTPRPRTTFNLYGSRQFEESTSVDSGFYTSELVGGSVNQIFGARWNAFAYVNQTHDDFQSGRKDDILDYGLGLRYSLKRWLSLGAEYGVIERNSNVPDNDYKDRILTLSLNGIFEIGN